MTDETGFDSRRHCCGWRAGHRSSIPGTRAGGDGRQGNLYIIHEHRGLADITPFKNPVNLVHEPLSWNSVAEPRELRDRTLPWNYVGEPR